MWIRNYIINDAQIALSFHEGDNSNVLSNQAYAILRVVTYNDGETIGILSSELAMNEIGVGIIVSKT